ncbi:aspartyl aminopeptidase domain protein [Ostertagia ostertagi]
MDEYSTPRVYADHHANFVNIIAEVAETTPDKIVDMDLYLYDVEPARRGGIRDEFITGQRLDNAHGTYTMFQGFLNSLSKDDDVANDENIRVAVSFDNEETELSSAHGPGSLFLENVLKRISIGCVSAFELGASKSMTLCVDEAHASHPNHPEKIAKNHRPAIQGGLCVTGGAKFATTPTSHSVIKQIAAEAGVPLQINVDLNSADAGETFGSELAASLGILAVDIGGVELAMHSIRPMCGARGVDQAIRLYSASLNR